MTEPIVSVIIPTHNRAHVVPRAIRSVLAQTFKDFELLVVDDASTDATEDVVRGFTDTRIRYLRRQTNGGVSAAQNTGLAAARGEFISILHSDDEYVPTKLEVQVPRLRARGPEIGAVKGCVTILDGAREVVRLSHMRDITAERWLGYEKGVHVSPMLMRRPVAQALGFDESLVGWEDVDFLIRFLEVSRIEVSDEPLVRLRGDGGHRLSSAANQLRGMQGVLVKYDRELRARPAVRYRWHLIAAHLCGRVGDRAGVRRHLRECLSARPVGAAAWLLYGGVLLGDRAFALLHRGYTRASRVKAAVRSRGRGVAKRSG
jgi:glycosyltransferase involved in cell wall biosynthesis